MSIVKKSAVAVATALALGSAVLYAQPSEPAPRAMAGAQA